jgi:leader peptidase (prepilin peptidase)/N-methyltransferase
LGVQAVTGRKAWFRRLQAVCRAGSWFGWLIPIILLASVIGAVVGIAMKFSTGLREGGYVPFGPFLAGAGFAALFLGPGALRQAVGL